MEQLMLSFAVRDLRADDLPSLGWAGTGVPDGLERAARGGCNQEAPDGTVSRYETTILLFRKALD